ncbi:hypothetical protein AAZX31_18G158900 [Glycine max]
MILQFPTVKILEIGFRTCKLANEGSKDWTNLSAKLKSHEITNEHITNMNAWIDLEMRLVKNKIIDKHDAKYYAIILDCTPDISHQESMSFVLRCVDISSTPIQVNEYFLEFLKIDDTSGKGLFDAIIDELKIVGLDINDLRGQGYDNGSNMKGKHQGVQKRFLDINPRSFYIPCGCHSLNLVLCDMANSCPKATSFFGVLQCVYTLFSSSTKRWKILQNHIHNLTHKSLSQTRWESRIESVKAIRFQIIQIRDALFELAEANDDPKIKSEADCLTNYELENFEFLLDMTICKNLQLKYMCIDETIEQLKEPKFREKCISCRKKQFDKNVEDEIVKYLQESFRIDYFLYIVDKVITTNVKKLKLLNCTLLKEKCLNLEISLKHDNLLDEIIGLENDKPIDILNYIKRINSYIAYRIMLTIPLSLASAEMNFSKLKIIKTYLRSTMSQ